MSKKDNRKSPEPQKDELKETEASKEEAVQSEAIQDPMEALNQEIEALQAQLAQSRNEVLKAYADTDNTRKRLQRETELAKKYKFQSAALELLPILDNLDLALAAKPENPEVANFVKGFEMIRTQLVNALTSEGVQEIEALGQPFDPNWMQALMTEPSSEVPAGTVLEVLQKGYKLKDRMLRPALVKVSE